MLIIAYLTLIERKLLRLSQSRKGPDLVGSFGLLQPFSDGLKLISKHEVVWNARLFIYLLPSIRLYLIFLFWFPLTNSIIYFNLGAFYLLAVGSSLGLAMLGVGWFGGSTYSFIGGLRASAQIVSYEVVLSFFFLLYCSIDWTLNLFRLSFYLRVLLVGMLVPSAMWLVVLLAETNRAPFDIREGESELVRGFNTEYSGILFTILFLGEYGMIAGYRILRSYFLQGGWALGLPIILFILWVRSCFPRKRYDSLISILWVYYFPTVLVIMLSWVFYLII